MKNELSYSFNFESDFEGAKDDSTYYTSGSVASKSLSFMGTPFQESFGFVRPQVQEITRVKNKCKFLV